MNVLKPTDLTKLMNLIPIQSLREPAESNFKFSLNANEWCKKSNKQIYQEILHGNLFLAPPEKTKKGTKCWSRGLCILLKKVGEEKADNDGLSVESNEQDGAFAFSGVIIHHAVDRSGKYCGWLTRKKTKGTRTSDLNKHVNSCRCGVAEVDGNSGNLEEKQSVICFKPIERTEIKHNDILEMNETIKD